MLWGTMLKTIQIVTHMGITSPSQTKEPATASKQEKEAMNEKVGSELAKAKSIAATDLEAAFEDVEVTF